MESVSGATHGQEPQRAIIGRQLGRTAFLQFAGILAGRPFVKFVWDRAQNTVHFINSALYSLHAIYIAENILGMGKEEMINRIDEFNRQFYMEPDRRFCLGVLSLQENNQNAPNEDRQFLVFETTEVDLMHEELLCAFTQALRSQVRIRLPLLWKPANHHQETLARRLDPLKYPRIFARDLYASREFVPLHPGSAEGRVRHFATEAEYREARPTLQWYDILVMDRVPDDIPRISGIINTQQTTPLSHTNVLATGWQIPNCVQIGIEAAIEREHLNLKWVRYVVSDSSSNALLVAIPTPEAIPAKPAWATNTVAIHEPEVVNTPIRRLADLRMRDSNKYGTKAANIGELATVLREGSNRLLGYYSLPRPPRANLLEYATRLLGKTDPRATATNDDAHQFLIENINIPRGVAIPFSAMQEFLESSPRLQQTIGKLKMALELNARQVDALCVNAQRMIREIPFSDKLRAEIMTAVFEWLSGARTFVVRSSSNAEDLVGFSAAGIYESINHVTNADRLLESVKAVWASLVSPRAVHLRHDAGISLDDAYMGVIIQEEIPARLGGVLVTTNPVNTRDFRNVYLNVSPSSVQNVVQGSEIPMQFHFNVVEGGGRTLSLGSSREDLSTEDKEMLQRLSFAGRLLQSHYSDDDTFEHPADIEWLINDQGLYILQLRPFGG
jgi:hypothetical protein